MMPGLDGGKVASYFPDRPIFKDITIVFFTTIATKAEVTLMGA